ncbi:glycosyltransferase family 4 protein [Tanticharoenia sakaeratensis]|uniref:Glycosyltransferase n=1 Tax=Tanticharoenia sakaeratensis NBRC 103193 TaxID=1231623 RepID=A0A0D6MPS4_9PROT|nr:glycosyltransferase family 1 protein [Tanticharoenia sakaeratensis]GAN55436.1 glycosyltransferase [Tanticharoenia sakaeratensis NBRC 103193]GBQ22074.1 glycosyltransferase [Tanticharoenia sakaeratensis NBRC 103193]
MRILIATDAWLPQVNGVVRTMSTVVDGLRARGHEVEVVGPDRFHTVPCPTYPEIRLATWPGPTFARIVKAFRPQVLHIVTEAPIGWAAWRWARRRGLPFTTSYHTRFPEYVQARLKFGIGPCHEILKRFHNAGEATLVATASLRDDLAARGFTKLTPWTRGVDLERFSPTHRHDWTKAFNVPGPVFINVGRVAVEKNIEAFLSLDLPGTKIVVGDGPQRAALQRRFPDTIFTGRLQDRDLASAFAGGDVFVFPSLTDTFGLVLLESLACGTPVAGFDVTGPRDIVGKGGARIGAVGSDLRAACLAALKADRAACRPYAEQYTWAACIDMFENVLRPFPAPH